MLIWELFKWDIILKEIKKTGVREGGNYTLQLQLHTGQTKPRHDKYSPKHGASPQTNFSSSSNARS